MRYPQPDHPGHTVPPIAPGSLPWPPNVGDIVHHAARPEANPEKVTVTEVRTVAFGSGDLHIVGLTGSRGGFVAPWDRCGGAS